MADHTGYSVSYLSRIETGQKPATPDIARSYDALLRTAQDRRRTRTPKKAPARGHAAGGLDLGIVWFGAEVRRLRMARGMSLTGLGAEVYLSRAYLGKIEQGRARGTYQHALALDTALEAEGRLARLFLDEYARVGPTPADTAILMVDTLREGYPAGDPEELAAEAAVRLQSLRVRSHQAGPFSVLQDLSEGVAELHHRATRCPPTTAKHLWPVALQYAELLGWSAQETGHDNIALRWTRLAAEWARTIGDTDAMGYAYIRQSQWARRRGDSVGAVGYARLAAGTPRISLRIQQFAAQREAQAFALAGNELSFRRALERYHDLLQDDPGRNAGAGRQPAWGPRPDPAYEESPILEATCLVDLGDFHTAAALFDQHMGRLATGRTGYARLAIREAIAYAHVGDADLACEVALRSLPIVARQGSASLRGDLNRLTGTLNRHRRRPAVRDLLPDLAMLARAAGSTPTAAGSEAGSVSVP